MDDASNSNREDININIGLTENEVAKRRAMGLSNTYESNVTKTTGAIVKTNVCTWFNLLHFLIGIAIFFTGQYWNLLYLLVIIVNIGIGINQELHAKRLIEQLNLLSDKTTTVIRAGEGRSVSNEELVLDDILQLNPGNQIVSDAIVRSGVAEVNEALLTGEAEPFVKHVGDKLLSGSFIISGQILAQVNHVGKDNYTAKITLEAKKQKESGNNIIGSMHRLTQISSYLVLPIIIILFIQAFFVRNSGYTNAIIPMATALLGILPKGMELFIGVSFIAGVIRLSQKHVLTHDLYSVENLAKADVICLDKTGTITEGKIVVTGFTKIENAKLPVSVEKAIQNYVGETTDTNATSMALKEHFGDDHELQVELITPFSSARKWGAITFKDFGTLILGAPERVIKNKTDLPDSILFDQKQGKRIVCLAFTPKEHCFNELPDSELVATIELSDQIRTNVSDTLNSLSNAGMDIKIISGDSPVTVAKIAKTAGVTGWENAVDMSEIKSPQAMQTAAVNNSIFGRVTPNQKQDLIRALQKQGHSVAMIGDGVNDVLALKEADCSIAMNSGSSAAKQVSQFVLLDSNFSVLPDIVREGHRVINIIMRVGSFFFVKNLYSLLLAVCCIFLNTAFPFSPIQISLIDMVIEGYVSMLMQFEPNDQKVQAQSSLRYAIRRALPFALTIVIGIGLIQLVSGNFNLNNSQIFLMMFYLTAWGTILAIIRVCLPITPFRVWIIGSMVVAFFIGSVLFQKLILINTANITNVLITALITLMISCVILGIEKIIQLLAHRKENA